MKILKKEFILACNASKAWQLIVNRKNYETWAAAFQEGSTYQGTMALNETITFGDGSGNGLVAQVTTFIPQKEINFSFLGEKSNHQLVDASVFTDMFEHYLFEEDKETTKMSVTISLDDQYYDMICEMWDRAGIELIKLSKASI